MATKASETRIERYSQRVEELKAARRKAVLFLIMWGVLVFADWIIAMIIFYQDKNIGLEPIFWFVMLAGMLICFVGEYFSYRKFSAVSDDYHEALDRYEKLTGKNKAQEAPSEDK